LAGYLIIEGGVIISQERLCNYELAVVFSPQIAEEDITAAIEKVSQFITQKGGEVGAVNRWGRRKLAYPIKHFTEGNYALTQFKLQPNLAAELETNLRGSEEILRHLLVRLEE
jgi:small subunit ribosomal protein S6